MIVTPFDAAARVERQHHIRGGRFRFWPLAEGEPGTPHNFSLQLGEVEGDFFSPRHRHNFDQIRFQVQGAFDFGADGQLDEGDLGYFPERTRYGPQKGLTPVSRTLTLQFGGASGSGYMSEQRYQQSAAALQSKGSFSDGVFTWHRSDGKKVNQDAYEAVWEHANGRPLEYAAQRYARPVFMTPANFGWLGVGGQPGVQVKHLASFTEALTQVALWRLETGRKLVLAADSLYFIWRGQALVGNQTLPRFSSVYNKAGDSGALTAQSELEVLQMRLPGNPAAGQAA